MGDIADMIIDGEMCEECGEIIDDDAGYGPRLCRGCERQSKRDERNKIKAGKRTNREPVQS